MTFPKPNNIVAEKYVAGMSLFKSKLAKKRKKRWIYNNKMEDILIAIII